MRIIIFWAVIVLISLHSVYAQADFRRGYVVLNSGDTLDGLIDYRGFRSSTQRCIFKQNHQAPKQVFYPDEALAYRYTDGKYFISRDVTLEGETYRLFLEYIFNGIVDVFYFGGLEGNNYLIESDGIMYALEPEKTKFETIGKWTSARINEKYYVDVLKALFSQSPMVVSKVSKVSLRHKDLIEISSDFHTQVCTDDQPYVIYEKQLPAVISTYGPIAGLCFNRMTVSADSPFYTFNNSLNNPMIPALGFFFAINIPLMSRNIHIVYESMYFNRSLQAQYNYSNVAKSDITLSQDVWQSSLTMKYRFPGLGLRPSVQGGVYFNKFFNNRFHSNTDFFSDRGRYYRFSEENDIYPYNTYDWGYFLGTGLAARKWFIDLRYHIGFGMRYNVFTQAIQLNVGYSLNKL